MFKEKNLLLVFLSIIFLLFAEGLFSQSKEVAGNEYQKFGNNWYMVDNGVIGSLVDTNHIIVQLKGKGDVREINFEELGLRDIVVVADKYSDGFYQLKIPSWYKPFAVLEKLKKSSFFSELFFNIYYTTQSIPNDYFYNNQWNLTKVNMPDSWDITTGENNIIVAIIDDGTDYNHEDLQGNIWSNIGYDFYDNDSNPYPFDGSKHGTAVAGIIGALTNNGKGVAGVAGGWNSSHGIRLMILKAGSNGNISNAAVAMSIDYAAQNGAKVINMSFSSSNSMPDVKASIDNAVNNYGVTCIASSGNKYWGTLSGVHYPAAYANVIAVGATTENDIRKEVEYDGDWGSRYGLALDIMAPGVNIPTTDVTGSVGFTNGNYYLDFSGTSAAAPIVSGTVALMYSINPNLTFQDVYTTMIMTADNVSAMNNQLFSSEYGYGRLNTYNAVKNIYERSLAEILADQNKSVNQTATAQNNSRKLVKDQSGNYHLVFVSAGEIYYRKSTNGGFNWQNAIKISSNNNFNSIPCITLNNYYGVPSITWQREFKPGSFEIYFAFSRDNGNTWNSNDRYIVSSVGSQYIRLNPLPVIQGTQNGTMKVITYVFNGGMWAHVTNDLYPTSTSNWTVYNVSDYYQGYNPTLTDDWAYNKTLLSFNTPYDVKYRYFDGSSWSSVYNLSSIVPGGIHRKPSIANNPNGSQIYITWERITNGGATPYDYTIVYREANRYNNWKNEYFSTYYYGQQLPSITSIGSNEIYLLFQAIPSVGNQVYKQFFDGSIWSPPTLIASNSVYPSVSKGKTVAKYVYTSGVTSPYNIVTNSDFLSKKSNEPIRYSRSVSVLDSSGAFLELQLHAINLFSDNSKSQEISLQPFSLDTLDFTVDNCWALQKSQLINLPIEGEKITFDYSLIMNEVNRIIEGGLPKVELNIIVSTKEQKSTIKGVSIGLETGKTKEVGRLEIPVSQLSFEKDTKKITVGLEINSNKFKEGTFASLGHLFDFTEPSEKNNDNKESETKYVTTDYDLKNFPNPFNPTTKIYYSLPEANYTTLKIYDILGREIVTLVEEVKQEGTYEVSFNAYNLPSGIYISRLISGGKRIVNKMLLIK